METTFGIICGGIAILVGLILVIKRKSVSDFTANAQRSTFGKAGEKVADRANPGYAGIVGGGFIVIGAMLVIFMLAGVKM